MSYIDGGKMNRQDWEFDYTASNLAAAALTKAHYREDRERWWIETKAKVMAEVRESGIEISESLASNYTSNAGRSPQVMVRADLQTKLAECHAKITEHNRAARDYRGWAQVLKANAEARLKLKHSDWLYFFGDDAVLNPEDRADDED